MIKLEANLEKEPQVTMKIEGCVIELAAEWAVINYRFKKENPLIYLLAEAAMEIETKGEDSND